MMMVMMMVMVMMTISRVSQPRVLWLVPIVGHEPKHERGGTRTASASPRK
jgi:hypothetical protein